MYDFVHKNKRMVQIILAIMVLPFAFVGVDSYVRNIGNDQDVATVGGKPISAADFENALRQQQDQMRNILGRNFDPAMFDNAEVRQQVLDGVINQRLLAEKANNLSLTAPDAELRRVILEIPAFQEDGKFSEKRYDEALKGIGQSRLMFEQRLRSDLSQQPMQDALARAAFIGNAQAAAYQRITEEAREVQVAQVVPDAYLAKVKVADADVRAEYDKNPDAYRAPEQVKVEYLKLDQAQLAAQVSLTPDELKKAYDEKAKEFTAPEERKASHILLNVEKDEKGKVKSDSLKAMKAKAEELMKKVGTDATKFAEVAKTESQDPGSAAQGGDLGFNRRGSMEAKLFEDTMFSMKTGEVRGPIESDFGVHIIRLTEIKPERIRAFDEVKAQIESETKQARASKLFAESAEKFQNRAYEEGDSYAKLAEELKLKPVKTDWLTRGQLQAIAAGNQKLAQAVFSPANIASKRNSESIDLGNNSMISARVLEHKPSAVRPFDDVKAQIATQLQRKAATEMAVSEGIEKTKAVAAGRDVGLTFGAVQKLTRQGGVPGVNANLSKQVFSADLSKGLAVVGAASDAGGYSIVRVLKTIDAEAATPDKLKSVAQRLLGQSGNDISNAYLTSLKDSIKVEMKKGVAAAKKDDAAATDAPKTPPAKS